MKHAARILASTTGDIGFDLACDCQTLAHRFQGALRGALGILMKKNKIVVIEGNATLTGASSIEVIEQGWFWQSQAPSMPGISSLRRVHAHAHFPGYGARRSRKSGPIERLLCQILCPKSLLLVVDQRRDWH